MKELTDESRAGFSRLQDMYAGDLLPQGADENWVVLRSVDLHNRYLDVVHRYLELLKAAEEYDEIVCVARLALDVDAFDERLNLDLMDALVHTKRENELMMQYRHTSSIYYRFLGARPPEGIQEFYRRIVNAGEELEVDIDRIRADLTEAGDGKGAFVCDYATLKGMYGPLERSMDRLGQTIFVVLCRINAADGQPIEPAAMAEWMKRLLEIMRAGLRQGDAISQFGPSQYVLLLPAVNYDTCKMIMEGVRRTFYGELFSPNVMLTYRMGPLNGRTA